MTYVYILQSLGNQERYYVGVTGDLRNRLGKHNAGDVSHTSKYVPWKIKTHVAFSDEERAFAFEKYLKSPSGRAFAKKRLYAKRAKAAAPKLSDAALNRVSDGE